MINFLSKVVEPYSTPITSASRGFSGMPTYTTPTVDSYHTWAPQPAHYTHSKSVPKKEKPVSAMTSRPRMSTPMIKNDVFPTSDEYRPPSQSDSRQPALPHEHCQQPKTVDISSILIRSLRWYAARWPSAVCLF